MGSPLALAAPERIHYFYGLLLDADRLQEEQNYFNGKRWLMNRLGFGWGVLRGLGIASDPSTISTLVIDPGVAIDAWGREIVVPTTVQVDATQLTDAMGNPAGPAGAGADVIISLAYAESQSDPVPVLVADCDHPGNCAPASVREGFRILVRTATGPPPPPPGGAAGSLPLPTGLALEQLLSGLVGSPFPAPAADPSVPLARFTVAGGPLDAVSDRRLVYSNGLLFQMIVSLIDNLNSVAGASLLLYVSGDAQSGSANTALPNPLVVALQDGSGNPVTGGLVQFSIAAGGGTVTPAAELPGGKYSTQWTLGVSGAQTVVVKAAGTNLNVTFEATVL